MVVLLLVSPALWSQRTQNGEGDYYPLAVGNRWDFRVKVGNEVAGSISEVVAQIDTIDNLRLFRLEAQVGGKVVATEHLEVTPKGVYRRRAQGAEVKTPALVLRYPAKGGDSWEYDTQVGNQRIEAKVKTRFEEVEVPAGKFKALATEIDIKADGKPLKTTIWFAPGIGKVKTSLDLGGTQVVLELEKFTKGKPQK
jgi:phage pi2 protein 07